MAAPRRCTICGRFFTPEVRSRRHQRACSPPCSRRAKQRYDRLYHRQVDATVEGRACKREKNRQYRQRVDWTRQMRYRRKADARRTARINRQAAQRYYWRNRDPIVQKRREQRARRKASRKARSQ